MFFKACIRLRCGFYKLLYRFFQGCDKGAIRVVLGSMRALQGFYEFYFKLELHEGVTRLTRPYRDITGFLQSVVDLEVLHEVGFIFGFLGSVCLGSGSFVSVELGEVVWKYGH